MKKIFSTQVKVLLLGMICLCATSPVHAIECQGDCRTSLSCTASGGTKIEGDCPAFDANLSNICCQLPKPKVDSSAVAAISLPDPLNGVGFVGVLNRVIMAFLGMVGAIALLVFVYAGVLYMTAGGTEDQVTEAKGIMKNAVIGLAVILFAYVLTSFYFTVLTKEPQNITPSQTNIPVIPSPSS